MKTKTFLQGLCLAGALLLTQSLSAQYGTQFDGGSGTPDDPYLISTADQLNSIRQSPGENRSHKLTQDIDLGAWIAANPDQNIRDYGWVPIDVNRKVFDGNGKKIIGFWTNRNQTGVWTKTGLFDHFQIELSTQWGDSAIVKNLTIEIDNTKKVIGKNDASALIGRVDGSEDATVPVKIVNCHVIGDIDAYSVVGGLVGRVQSPLEIIGSSFTGTIKQYDQYAYTGGIVGDKYEGRASFVMKDCYSKNTTLTGRDSNTGGLAGRIGPNSLIENCYVEDGTITATGGPVGGLIGNLGGNTSVDNLRTPILVVNSHTSGMNITSTGGNIAGLIGQIEIQNGGTLNPLANERARTIDITNCYAKGTVKGAAAVGGLIGGFYGGSESVVSDSYAEVTITSNYGPVGGLIATTRGSENILIKDSHFSGSNTFVNNGDAGGLVGRLGPETDTPNTDASSIQNCYASGSLTGSSIGGLVAWWTSGGSIEDSYSDNIILGDHAGGLIGRVFRTGTNATKIINSHRIGDVKAVGDHAGGLVGTYESGDGSSIENSYATGDVQGQYRTAGGLVGNSDGAKNLQIKDSHYKGNVSCGSSAAGGLVGIFGATGGTDVSTIKNSSAQGKVTGRPAGGLVGKYQSTGSIEKSFALDSIANGYWNDGIAGGLVGEVVYPASIIQSYAAGNVQGDVAAGGLVGKYSNGNAGSIIQESYAVNSLITRTGGVGGLVGVANESANLTITNSFALNSAVFCEDNASRNKIIGKASGSETLTNVIAFEGTLIGRYYWDTFHPEDGGATNDENYTNKSKKEIAQQATYAGWDFTNTWTWRNGAYRLPVLKDLTGQLEVQPTHLVLNTDATLSALTVSTSSLSPAFDAATTAYTVNVPYTVTAITLTATVSEETSTASGDGEKTGLVVGDNDYSIVVTAEDDEVTKTYTVKVVRAAPSTDATLSALTVSVGTLTPVFAPATTAYTVDVAYNVTSITLTATTGDANASLVGDGAKTGLTVGDNDFSIVVTAEDGTTTGTYTVKVVRAAPSTDATLSALTVSAGTLDPVFAPATTTYSVEVANTVTSITITATAGDAKASLVGDGAKTVTVGDNVFNIVVTAEDGTTTETYTVTVKRADFVSIKDVQSGVHYQVVNRSIEVTGAEGIITLTNLTGLSKKFASKGNVTNVPVSAAGVYVLTINNISYKVVVK
jgi:hypothetical protein